ncbi:OsmC family protein [Paenibacillus sp. PsM32]|uniref:OsmC family protein n=1 Tax=Paenibacillus kyungheensis TaxID=1452732 RepID=A0AAX3M5T6_9BACL|nr:MULTISPECIES: OsmC family protein [Paenibacillus]MDN4617303.1 OsmC family protein [Paenibacillus sp. PsM32]MDQ1232851.1 peroxiredoxin-like protein [Paenibacillus sp. SORGH_AS_0306]MDR6109899.1 peroxiredoxin-like protein [Paenibacillus sp. SORGH_AS_0338]WCT56879.1 OsmC family protein [Paenibacillus kyungheensis]WDF50029.1 OsmC family protein [Paenibacillus sp. KACC 21273]
MKHQFVLDANWQGGRNSEGTIESGNLKTAISIPQPMGGPGIGTNPDEMLLGAAATCYIITLAAMLERSNITVARLTMKSEGIVDVTNNIFTYEQLIHRPEIVLSAESADQVEKATVLAHKAEQSCMISRAIAGNVTITTQPLISIAD